MWRLNFISLLLFHNCWIQESYGQKEWPSPGFIKPEPLDEEIKFWSYDETYDMATVILNEEVEHNVTIADFNYNGDETPRIKKFDNKGGNNENLGAKFQRNSNGFWQIVITKKQDFETPVMRLYVMTIVINSVQKTYNIQLSINNIDDNPPIIQANERYCSIEENYEGLSNCTFTVSDVDGWIDKTTFNISSTPNSGAEHFSLVQKAISGSQFKMIVTLNVTKSLDFETMSVYTLGITATDTGNNTSNNLITVVRVIDLPDMPPVWTNLINALTIWEKSINKFQVSAIDGDYEINAPINYKIENLEAEHDFFEVEKETGEITINEIDRDTLKQEIFKFMIVAYEVDNITSLINSTIVVVVNDINDHSPEIGPTDLSIDIREETYMNLEFSEPIVITDPDLALNAQFDVKLVSDQSNNWTSAFIIIPNSAYQLGTFTISVVNASLLDYEDENWRSIIMQIVATERANSSHVGSRDVKINLINWNDEFPIFKNDNMIINVLESVPLGYHVATVFATDRDVGDHVTHTLVSQYGLEIDSETGKITTTEEKSFDHEAIPIVFAQVVATDEANHKTYATLTINVIDVNDKPPKIVLAREKPTLEEEVLIGTKVNTKIYANDPDSNAELKFSIEWNTSTAFKSNSPVNESLYEEHLTIETIYPKGKKGEAEAELIVNGRIDFEAFDTMYLTIVVTDLKTELNDNSTSASLTLSITDINDNPPEFDEVAEMRTQENQKSGILIGRVTAHDIDGPGNNLVTYSIKPVNGTEKNLISIDKKIGDIKVDKDGAIDAEIYEYLYYNITATDGVYNTIKTIEIYVIDENDEYPAAVPDKFETTVHIKERSETGTKIVQVCALDKDRTHPFNNVSYLISSDYPQLLQYFRINKFNGWLEVNLVDDAVLDRDRGPSNYSVFLRLRDNFIEELSLNSNQNTTMVTVILDDINNQIPELPDLPNPAKIISEDTKKDSLVLTVTAEDKDDPNTDNTKVFYEIKEVVPMSNQTVKFSQDCPILFKVETIDKKHAKIRTNCHLKGYYGVWALKLYVQDLGTDPGPLNDTKVYNIQITDYNYHDPEIIFPVAGKIIRLSQVQKIYSELLTYDGQLLENFTATDKDFGESGVVTFSLSGKDAEKFAIVSFGNNEAQLQLTSIPDFSKQYTFNPIVTATDHGQPKQRIKTQTQKIIFVSTQGPEFEYNEFTTWFHENTTGLNNYTIIPEAKDMINEGIESEPPVDIYYYLESDEGDMAFFSLNKETRNLTLKKELDREAQEKMTLRIIATRNPNGTISNPRDKAILTVTVIVVDVNDNPPVFVSKAYFGGVALEDAVGKVILSVKATDADLNDSLTYKISEKSLTTSDTSLEGITNPFQIKESTGELSLGFKPTSYMIGYFSLDILVQDEAFHEDSTYLKIYMIAKDNRVTFTFKNKITSLNENKLFIIEEFSKTFEYVCNIDYIEKGTSSRAVAEDVTTVTTHFINEENNLPVSADIIIVKANTLEVMNYLLTSLRSRDLLLVAVPTSSRINNIEDNHDILQWVLLCLTTLFFVISIALLVAYIVRVRGLTERLDKMAITNYDSPTDPTIEKISIMPNSNKFALEGSNPMWKTEPIKEIDDNISHGSGDSDLIGIEDNPNFEYDPKTKNIVNINTFGLSNAKADFNEKKFLPRTNSVDDEYTC